MAELLRCTGVPADTLSGTGRNRNGIQGPDETDGNGACDRGWSAFLTVHSRESNRDSQGNAAIFLNENDLSDLYDKLTSAVSQDVAKFLILYRQYGSGSSSSSSNAGGGGTQPILIGHVSRAA